MILYRFWYSFFMSKHGDLIETVPLIFSSLTNSDAIFYSPSISGELYTGPIETRDARLAIGAMTNLVNAATRASSKVRQALSWRGYNVGATAIMVNFDTGMMGYLDGCNVKPSPGDSELNIHAEQMAISKGRRAGLTKVVGLSVFADPDNADANPTNRPTLAPCGRCTEMFTDIPEINDTTLILGTNQYLTTCELYTFGELTGNREPLLGKPFSLETDNDLETYDREIKPILIPYILGMFS
jgi:cytidine deaminase